MEVGQHDRRGVGSESNSDLLSVLPVELIENILVRLPIKEAIRTSTLSSRWKNKWVSIPNLVFNEDSVGYNLIRFVDMVLLAHQGPILTFQVDYNYGECSEAVQKWVYILSQNGIKDLRLCLDYMYSYCRIPSSLFSCHKLEHLEISKCSLNALQCFQGFKFLRTLKLSCCDLIGVTIEKFVSSCPLLETLELDGFLSGDCLVIRAPNLRKLSLRGGFTNIYLETPNLISSSIYSLMYYPMNGGERASNLRRVLGQLPHIEKLDLKICKKFTEVKLDWFQCLSFGHTPKKFPVTYHCLKNIEMYLCSASMEGLEVALCIFRCAPNLKTLDIGLPSQNIWEDQRITTEISFKHLEVVKIRSYEDAVSLAGFAKFLLSTSSMLEKLIIAKYCHLFEDSGVAFLRKLASLPRLSTKVMILFVDENF